MNILRLNNVLGVAATSISFITISFLVQGHTGLNLADEGYLWYGTQRVMLGEVPIRDFMSYDPGRYYWSAALMHMWGNNGIMALRGAVAVFQAAGLFVGLLLINQYTKKPNNLYIFVSCLTLMIWMFPRHKLFDISLSLLLIWVLAFMVSSHSSRRFFISGLCIGLIAIFGRNHGMYGAVGSIGIIIWLKLRREGSSELIRSFGWWLAGVTVGFMPLILMAILVPGFAKAFLESIYFLFEAKATNLPLPIPWPWQVSFQAPFGEAIRELLVGIFFIAIVTFGVLSVVWLFWNNFQNRIVSPGIVASAFLILPYAHFAYSRADINHLAQGIFPFLVWAQIVLAAQSPMIKWTMAIFICLASIWVMHTLHPGWQCFESKQCANIKISGSNLLVDRNTADNVALLRKLSDQYTPHGESFLVTPYWPGAYPLLERKSPVWEIFALFPRNNNFEKKEIERINRARPRFIMILDFPLDGRDELRFRNTHPLIYQYILDNFEQRSDAPNPAYQIYKYKEGV